MPAACPWILFSAQQVPLSALITLQAGVTHLPSTEGIRCQRKPHKKTNPNLKPDNTTAVFLNSYHPRCRVRFGFVFFFFN